MIKIVTRDINGKRNVLECKTETDVLTCINDGAISEEDEILIVSQDNLCLYSALSCPAPLDIDDLTGFFG